MIPVSPLLAQGELIGILIMILVFVIPAIFQALNKQAQRQKKRPLGQRPPARPPGANVEAEIEEFLRRAAQGRGAQPPARARRPRPGPAPPMVQVVGRQGEPPKPAVERPVGVGMAEHVQEYLDRDEFQRRTAGLGGQLAQAEQQTEQRLQQAFGHEVSHLAHAPGESAAVTRAEEATEPADHIGELPPTAAAGLAALFSDVTSVRRAIVINEILQRPEDRWS